jgi:hypothetical protein
MNMSIYKIILAIHYRRIGHLRDFLTFERHVKFPAVYRFIELALFFNDDEKVDSAFLMIKIIKTELRLVMDF